MDIVERSKQLMLALGAAPVLWLMLILSVVSLTIITERAIFFVRIRVDFPRLVGALARTLDAGDIASARETLARGRSVEARVACAGLGAWERGEGAVRDALASRLALEKELLEARLGVLGTLGNNAPFVGLLGTVIGIMLAFEELSHATVTAQATSGVMASIAEALVATAIGLCVAIPAVAAYNAFQRRVRGTIARGEALAHILMVHLGARGPAFSPKTEGGDARRAEA